MALSKDEEIINQLMENIEKEKQSKKTQHEIQLKAISKDAEKEEYRRKMVKEVWFIQTGREMLDIEYMEYIDLIEAQPKGVRVYVKDFGYLDNLRAFADYKKVSWGENHNEKY